MTTMLAGKPLLSVHAWKKLRQWYLLHGRHRLPWRQAGTPWTVLMAEILLHRTRAVAVAEVFPVLVSEFPTPSAVLTRRKRWLEITRSLGLAWRSKTFIETCAALIRDHGGEVPKDHTTLTDLPGVGHYVARAVLNFGFGEPATIVDTNTIRLASRISGIPLDPSNHRSRSVQETVALLADKGKAPSPEDNLALLDLGAMLCRPKEPLCAECPIQKSCLTGSNTVSISDKSSSRKRRERL